MRQYYLYLDDLRDTPWWFDKRVKSYGEFVEFVNGQGKSIEMWYISFDHDLGEGKNGYDCAKFLINYCIENNYSVPEYTVHSANPVGAENIKSVFESYKKYAQRQMDRSGPHTTNDGRN